MRRGLADVRHLPPGQHAVDWSHPLARGLAGLFTLSGPRVSNLAGPESTTYPTTGPTLVRSSIGNVLSIQDAGNIAVPPGPGSDLTGDMSWSCWVLINDFGNYRSIAARCNGAVPGPIDINVGKYNGKVTMVRGDGSNYVGYTCAAGIPQGVWTHVAATSDAGNTTATFYYNGIPQTLDTGFSGGSRALGSVSNPLLIGGRADGATQWSGLLSMLKTWKRMLTPAEVLQDFQQPNAMIRAARPNTRPRLMLRRRPFLTVIA